MFRNTELPGAWVEVEAISGELVFIGSGFLGAINGDKTIVVHSRIDSEIRQFLNGLLNLLGKRSVYLSKLLRSQAARFLPLCVLGQIPDNVANFLKTSAIGDAFG